MNAALKVCTQCGTEYPANARFCEIDGTALRSAGAEQGDMVGTIVAERYHVMKKLGEGGMGQVYLAEHVKMGRKSALKVMNPGMVKDADAISRFNREASNASRINHQHVADVYDFGETPDGIIYLAMEFIDGPSLTKLMEEQGPAPAALPLQRTATIVRQAADALAAAHDLGIVHRDLKPDNIMIARTREGGDCVKVVDFGIAKAAENPAQKVTKTGLVVGTPEYMSPEQLAGDKLDGRSDIYALGLVAFNLLTGKLPFPANTVQESMIMRLTERPRKLSEMRPEVGWSPAVQAVLDRALERDAAARYQSASDFGRDFARAVEQMDAPAAARIPTTQQLEPVTPSPKTVPPTHVRDAPPHADVSRARNRRLLAGAGAVTLVAALSVAALVMMNGDASAGRNGAPQTANGTSTSVAPPPTRPNVNAMLDSLTKLADIAKNDRAAAQRALDGLDALEGRLATEEQTARAALARASALTLLDRTPEVCPMLEKVRDVKAEPYGPRIRYILEQSC